MPSRNDLSALKTGTKKPILPIRDNRGSVTPEPPKMKPETGRVGRPPKAKTDKRSYKITLSLTPAEGRKIAEKAGLAGEATFLYAFLKDSGAFD